MEWAEILKTIVAFAAGGGLYKILTLALEKKKLSTQVKQEATKVDQNVITNIKDIISVYNKTLEDFEKYYSQKEKVLTETNASLTKRIDILEQENRELTKKVAELNKIIQELKNKIEG